ncbi:MAG: multidrug effflux MFS transporter [Gammaproteobacteria bacterium]
MNDTSATITAVRYNDTIMLLLLLLITALGQVAVDIYLPSMPSMQAALGTSKEYIQLTLTVYTVGFGVSQLFYGPLSDRFGRRNLLLFGMALSAIASLGCALTSSIGGLITYRLIQGVGAGAASVLTRAILRDCYSGAQMSRIGGYMSIAWSLVPMIAPVLGSYIQTYIGWRGNFIFLIIFISITLLLTLRWLPDTNYNKRIDTLHPLAIIKNYWRVLTDKTAMRFTIGPMVTFGCMLSYITASPFLLQTDLGYSPVAFVWLSLLVSMSYLAGNLVNTRLLSRFEKMHLIRCGIILNAIGAVSMALLSLMGFFNVYTIIIPACIMIFSGGFLFANCMTSAMTPFINIAGTAAAIIGTVQMLGASAASGIVSQLPFSTPLPLSLLLVTLSCILALAVFNLKVPQHGK